MSQNYTHISICTNFYVKILYTKLFFKLRSSFLSCCNSLPKNYKNHISYSYKYSVNTILSSLLYQ